MTENKGVSFWVIWPSGKSEYYLLLLEGAYGNLMNFAKSEISDLTNLAGNKQAKSSKIFCDFPDAPRGGLSRGLISCSMTSPFFCQHSRIKG